MELRELYQFSWFSNLAYVKWRARNTNTSLGRIDAGRDGKRFPTALGERVFNTGAWTVSNLHANDETGFAANVFSNGNEKVLAIRGTEFDSTFLPPELGEQTYLDLLWADVNDIGLLGLAINQCISLFNYIQRLQADESNSQVLQLSLRTDARLGGGSAPTDLPYIKIHQPAFAPGLPGTDQYFWLEPRYDGAGLGVLSAGEQISVTGHSLGGHLAALAVRLFPGLFDEAVIFNSAGFDPPMSLGLTDEFVQLFAGFLDVSPAQSFAEISSRIVRVESEDSAPGDDVSVVSSLLTGTPVGSTTLVRTENNSHSMDQLMDALSVLSLLETLSPQAGQAQLFELYDRVSLQSGATEESLIEALSKLFLGNASPLETVEAGVISHGDFERRSGLHERTLEILAAVEGHGYTLVSLAGLSSEELLRLAEDSIAYRYAIQEMNPFVVLGNDALYLAHNQNAQLEFESFSDDYWRNRADFLVLKAGLGTLDQTVMEGTPSTTVYVDKATGLVLTRGSPDLLGPEASRVVFAGGAGPALTYLQGDSSADLVFGGVGSDILVGHAGADVLDGGPGDDRLFSNDDIARTAEDDVVDRLEGGAGSDGYIVGAGDRILDSDRSVAGIFHRGIELTGTYTAVSPGLYRNEETGVELLRDGSTAIFTLDRDGQTTRVRLENFSDPDGTFTNGDFGISLVDEAEQPDYSGSGLILGTEGPDRAVSTDADSSDLIGTEGGDVALGLGGADRILVLDGSDLADGGPGDDYISSVESYADTWELGDVLYGGLGDDVVIGSRGGDYVFGGAGGDFIQGRPGNDLLYGEGGNDTIYGGAGRDQLVGGDGDDTLDGDVAAFPRSVTWSASADSGEENIRIDVRYFYTPPGETGGDADILVGGGGRDTLLGHEGDDQLYGGAGDDTLSGHEGSDFLDGGDGADQLRGDEGVTEPGAAGDDVLHGGNGADSLIGHGGDDQLSGDAGNDSIFGGDGGDLVFGAGGDDRLYGGAGDDLLWGGAGTDVLDGDEGDNILRGEEGNDSFLFDGDAGRDRVINLDTVANSFDEVLVTQGIQTWDMRLSRDGSDLRIEAAGRADVMTIENWFLYRDRVIDQIRFSSGVAWNAEAIEAVLNGSGTVHPDLYFGTPGDDRFDGDGSGDFLLGATGDDVLIGGDGNDDLFGMDGKDSLSGGSGDDRIDGGVGDDVLSSGPSLNASDENGDMLSGGEGSDLYTFDLGDRGKHFIFESDLEGNDTDIIRFGTGIGLADLRIGRPVSGGIPSDSLTIELVSEDTANSMSIVIPFWFADGGGRIERMEFADGATVDAGWMGARINQAGQGHDYLTGTEGDDLIHGLAGQDEIDGAGGRNYLFGDQGSDRIVSSGSVNELLGGTGSDVLRVRLNFNPFGVTPVQFSLLQGDSGNDVLISDPAFPAAAAVVLDGGAGDDRLTGGQGAQTVFIGGRGNDRITATSTAMILFNVGDGRDRVVFADAAIVPPVIPPPDGEDDTPSFIGSSAISPEDEGATLSIGGAGPSQIALRRIGGDLIVQVGPVDQITLANWFNTSVADHPPISKLQIITQSTADYDPQSPNPMRNGRVVVLDFGELVEAFKADSEQTPNGASWTISAGVDGALLSVFDNAGLGGELAYQFALLGRYDDLDEAQRLTLMQAPEFLVEEQAFAVIAVSPTVIRPISDLEAWEDSPFTFVVPAETFESPFEDGALILNVTLMDGNPLPGWLHYDSKSHTLSGLPRNDHLGLLQLGVTATDAWGRSVVESFTLSVLNTNDSPVAVDAPQDARVEENTEFNLQVPRTLFSDPDPGDAITVTARLRDGSPLPGWLRFDGATLTFSGIAPADALRRYEIDLIGTDRAGASVTQRFGLTIDDVAEKPGDEPVIGTAGGDRLIGTSGSDRIFGAGGADVIDGGTGNDELYGGSGFDRLFGSDGDDFLSGDGGADILEGGAGADRLYGGAGADRLQGGPGDDYLLGGAHADRLLGGRENDTLAGGVGRDVLKGGLGDDVYVYGPRDGTDVIFDRSGRDVLRFNATVDEDDLQFLRRGRNLLVALPDGGTRVKIDGWFAEESRRIERFEFADGSVLLESQVQSLVQAMAGFSASSESSSFTIPGVAAHDWTIPSEFAAQPVVSRQFAPMAPRWIEGSDSNFHGAWQ